MSNTMWYLSRSSGIVAAVLMVAALLWGLLFSARETGNRLKPAWWLDLHNWLGGLALAFTGVHLLAVFGADLGIGLKQIFIPNTAKYQTSGMTWGVIAFYILVVTVFTSWPQRLFSRPVWRAIHVVSVPATVMAGAHGYFVGSDAGTNAFRIGMLLLVMVGVYPTVLRLLGLAAKRRAAGAS
jgi:DMSO/TMAO reductase YedYZ heme-binding membrane subunit